MIYAVRTKINRKIRVLEDDVLKYYYDHGKFNITNKTSGMLETLSFIMQEHLDYIQDIDHYDDIALVKTKCYI